MTEEEAHVYSESPKQYVSSLLQLLRFTYLSTFELLYLFLYLFALDALIYFNNKQKKITYLTKKNTQTHRNEFTTSFTN